MNMLKKYAVIAIVVMTIAAAGITHASINKTTTVPHPPAAKPATGNPFQALYDFFPKGGKLQSCVKKALGGKFSSAYQGKYISAELMTTFGGCINLGAELFPIKAQQCFKKALGRDYKKIMQNPKGLTATENAKIMQCPDMQTFITKGADLNKYTTKPTVR